jgi:toxin ParE1/3/4
MARVDLAEQVSDDFDRILDHLFRHQAADPTARLTEIMRAIDVLEFNPEIGRPTTGGLRELIIGRASHGFVALYSYVSESDTIFVLAIRSQLEAGYASN